MDKCVSMHPRQSHYTPPLPGLYKDWFTAQQGEVLKRIVKYRNCCWIKLLSSYHVITCHWFIMEKETAQELERPEPMESLTSGMVFMGQMLLLSPN